MARRLTTAQARRDWAKVLRTASRGTPVVVTSNGQPIAAVISIEQLCTLGKDLTVLLIELAVLVILYLLEQIVDLILSFGLLVFRHGIEYFLVGVSFCRQAFLHELQRVIPGRDHGIELLFSFLRGWILCKCLLGFDDCDFLRSSVGRAYANDR